MQRLWQSVAGLGVSLAVLAPGAAQAQTPPGSAIIGDTVITLGVSSDAGLARAGTGLQFVPTRADGLTRSLCACSGWSLVLGNTPLVESVEAFAFTPLGASSTVLVQD